MIHCKQQTMKTSNDFRWIKDFSNYPLFLFIILLFFNSCEKASLKLDESTHDVSVNKQTIIEVATLNFIKNQPDLKLKFDSLKLTDGFHYLDTSFTLKDNKGRDALHMFRFIDNKGWCIISGDNRFFPVLAFNSEGSAKLDTSLNPGLKFWVDDILQQIDFMDNHNITQSTAIELEWNKYNIKKLYHLKNEPPDPTGCIESDQFWRGPDGKGLTGLKWGQTAGFNHYMPIDYCDPLNYYCNKYPAGCGPVAIGMIMKYYQKPQTYMVNGTSKTANYAIMPNSISWSSVNCNNPTQAEQESSSLLQFAAGKYAQLWCFTVSVPFYFSSKSATALNPNKIKQTFADFGYSNSGSKIDYSSNIQRLIDNLKLYKPVIFSGSTCDVCFWNAHIWLCEGLMEHISESCTVQDWVYMNWGWSEADNGWYGISIGYTVNGYTFNNANMKIVVDIKP